MATRMIEIERCRCLSFSGNYDEFFLHRQEFFDAEDKQQQRFDKKLAQEEQWIRKGIKARRTRNEGRVRSLEAMRLEKMAQRKKQGQVKLKLQETEQSGKKVINAKNLNFNYGEDKIIVQGLDLLVERGDKIGIFGPNGAGKTTLIKILLGEIKPHQGTIKHGTQLNIAYFDQLHQQLDANKTVRQNLGDGSDMVDWNGGKKHVLGYLKDFLFPADRANHIVAQLSGGERNRLLLAKLFLQKSNFLVLDEPTNDLDTDTLDLLIDLLMNYEGTILFVSHDRDFINQIATSVLVFEEDGAKEYVGGYDDWLRQSETLKKGESQSVYLTDEKNKKEQLNDAQRKELFNLPKTIEQNEAKQAKLHDQMAHEDFYQQEQSKIDAVVAKLKILEQESEILYQRWEELESKS
jgi:ATP-binding cassette subfamily F protein uup